MIDRDSKFFAILTAVGEAKLANAIALGLPWLLTEIGVGDANNTDPIPDRRQTALIHEQRRAPLNQLRDDEANPGLLIAEQIIPADIGGWWVRELGLYDADGDLVAVANCAPSYKPLLDQGSGRTQVVRMTFIVSSTANVVLKIDPAVVLATREYVDLKVLDELSKQDFKQSVFVATIGPIALAGAQTIDGVAVPVGARVLVKDQAPAKDNGLYLCSEGPWRRTPDANTTAKVSPGLLVHVERGTQWSDSLWQLTTDAPVDLGASDLHFTMAVGRTGVEAGTYRSITVDTLGRVTAGTSPTDLAGYDVSFADQKESEAGVDTTKPVHALGVFQAIAAKVQQAAENALGIARLASQLQVNTGENDDTIVTPKKLRLGFSVSLGQNGYVVFPSWMLGLIFQWGVAKDIPAASMIPGSVGPTLDITLPIAYPTTALTVSGSMNFTTMSTTSSYTPGAVIVSNSVVRFQNNYTASAGIVSWWSVGC